MEVVSRQYQIFVFDNFLQNFQSYIDEGVGLKICFNIKIVYFLWHDAIRSQK